MSTAKVQPPMPSRADSSTIDVLKTEWVFDPSDAWSKFGFKDGIILHDLIVAWSRARGWTAKPSEGWEFSAYPYIQSSVLLWHLWHRHLADGYRRAGLEPPVVAFIDTAHNPIRVVDTFEDDYVQPFEPPVRVTVTLDDLLELADEVFPPRANGWLVMFCTVYDVVDSHMHAVDIVEYLARSASDGALQLAGELLAGDVRRSAWGTFPGLGDFSAALDDAMRSAHALV